jgi:hypothetical protein
MRPKPNDALLALVLSLAGLASAAAQTSPLGSPAGQLGRYSSDYAAVVRAATPRVSAAELAKLLEGARRAAAAEKPLAVTDLRQLERFFGLRERGKPDARGYLDVGEAVYRVDPEQQRFYLVRRWDETKPVPRSDFAPRLEEIRAAHRALAERLGIPSSEIFFADVREILSETDGNPGLGNSIQGEILAEGAVTTLLRAVGGIQVEGSYARFSSIDAQRIDHVDVRWPAVRIPERALAKGLRTPRETLDGIVRRVTEDSRGEAVNVRMAVVLRPVESGSGKGELEFVPSLKVGVEPRSVKTRDGYRTDAGEIFYVDLLRGAPAIAETPGADEERSEEDPAG